MDKLTTYRHILQQSILHHAEYAPSHGQIQTLPVCDTDHDNYLLVDTGWDATGRVHAVAFHARLHDGKVWIEWDGTEPSITEELVEAGIPTEDIVLAFYTPERRALTPFAVG